jgi:hypothetical protein
MLFSLAYDTPTDVISGMNDSAMAFAANVRRAPVSFNGVVRDPLLMRELMIAMHEVILSDARFMWRGWTLDPVITAHPDELFFEAFSSDSSVYVRLSAQSEAFEIESEPTYGTTNIDFTFALRAALQNMRSSRRTTFTVGAGGFGVRTTGAVQRAAHIENKVDLPDSWVKGFLQVSSALAMKPFTFHTRPVDWMNIIRYFIEHRNRKPPNALRYEFTPGQPIRVVLEPYEQAFPLVGTHYEGYPRVVRVWGRRRLELLLRVLPYADRVTVGTLGRGLPHFYIAHCGAYKFLLMLSGWSNNDWSAGAALDLLAPDLDIDGESAAAAYNALTGQLALSRAEVEAHAALDGERAEAALFRLCREGRAMFDPTTRRYRSRELFAEPLNFETILAPDPRLGVARGLVAAGAVTIHSVGPSERRASETLINANVRDAGADYAVSVAVDSDLRIRFAQCECDFFRDNIMSRGPCQHILAARFGAEHRLTI